VNPPSSPTSMAPLVVGVMDPAEIEVASDGGSGRMEPSRHGSGGGVALSNGGAPLGG
jgi:hypothetical protein